MTASKLVLKVYNGDSSVPQYTVVYSKAYLKSARPHQTEEFNDNNTEMISMGVPLRFGSNKNKCGMRKKEKNLRKKRSIALDQSLEEDEESFDLYWLENGIIYARQAMTIFSKPENSHHVSRWSNEYTDINKITWSQMLDVYSIIFNVISNEKSLIKSSDDSSIFSNSNESSNISNMNQTDSDAIVQEFPHNFDLWTFLTYVMYNTIRNLNDKNKSTSKAPTESLLEESEQSFNNPSLPKLHVLDDKEEITKSLLFSYSSTDCYYKSLYHDKDSVIEHKRMKICNYYQKMDFFENDCDFHQSFQSNTKSHRCFSNRQINTLEVYGSDGKSPLKFFYETESVRRCITRSDLKIMFPEYCWFFPVFIRPPLPPTIDDFVNNTDLTDSLNDSEVKESTPDRNASTEKSIGFPGSHQWNKKKFLDFYKKRHQLFYKFDQGILMDDESWYSVTPEAVASYIAERCRGDLVYIPFAGAGGDLIQCALLSKNIPVIASDIDPVKINCATHNSEIYDVKNRIEFVLSDALLMIPYVPADVVIHCPPWGGVSYKNLKSFDLDEHMDPGFTQLYELTKKTTSNMMFYLPRTLNPNSVLDIVQKEQSLVEFELLHLDGKLLTMNVYFGDLVKLL